jgi:hypothetical protein
MVTMACNLYSQSTVTFVTFWSLDKGRFDIIKKAKKALWDNESCGRTTIKLTTLDLLAPDC